MFFHSNYIPKSEINVHYLMFVLLWQELAPLLSTGCVRYCSLVLFKCKDSPWKRNMQVDARGQSL